ncbi:hypothetical protein SYNPS1DRAFT_26862 [Syncephalis pseudoplumigaleata]|uniref:F-box domain-containing protein n=1 Tax=Syncephalis pseudoplumigaleata TaxID=1712513 RepID=A0A4P9Z4X4_9FUNG|nr:hypothetical protein SYNPS1DRAFT_26862 [Syncephalis pseudoplumigaleata]|eukprot:RKP27478.1 hypothetical protein SYNPS1DRAFT_26862 [Syncephalis pseudoplumigaleata]
MSMLAMGPRSAAIVLGSCRFPMLIASLKHVAGILLRASTQIMLDYCTPVASKQQQQQQQQFALPIELLESIFLYLDDASIVALAACARSLGSAICQSERLWRHLYRKHYGHEEPLAGMVAHTTTTPPSLSAFSAGAEGEIHPRNGTSSLPVAQWLVLLRLRAMAPSIWQHGVAQTMPVALPRLNPASYAATEHAMASTSTCFPGELKLLDANKHGWSLMACTEPLAILLLHYPQPSLASQLSNTDVPISQWTSAGQFSSLSLDPLQLSGSDAEKALEEDSRLWTRVRYAPFHRIQGRLLDGAYAAVTMTAADAMATAGQWYSAIWVWRLSDRKLCWYARSLHPFSIVAMAHHTLLYRQRLQLAPTSDHAPSFHQPYNYANSMLTDGAMNSANEQGWTFILCNLLADDLDNNSSGSNSTANRPRDATTVTTGTMGCCHLHQLRSPSKASLQSMAGPVADAVVYRHSYDPVDQRLNWQLVRPTAMHDGTSTMTPADDLRRWRLACAGSLDCRAADHVHGTISTQIDNQRVVLTGMTRDRHQRVTPFVLLHSLDGDGNNSDAGHDSGLRWHCTGPRYAAQAVVVAPNLRYLLLHSMESMIRVVSLDTGEVLRSLPGLPHEGLPQPVIGDLWLVGATFHGELTLVDTERNEQYQHQLEGTPSPLVSSPSSSTADRLSGEMNDADAAHLRQGRLRPGLERQRWSVGLIGHNLLVCVRARAVSVIRFRRAAPTIQLTAPTNLTRRKSKIQLPSLMRRATISTHKAGGHDAPPLPEQPTQRPLQRKTTLLRTMARAITTFQQTIGQYSQAASTSANGSDRTK